MRLVRLAVITGLLLLTRPAHTAVVLQYHHISNDTPPSTSTSPERFAMHLDYLASNGFEVVPLQDLVAALRDGKPIPDKAAAITFDDGYASIYDAAWPLLEARGWPFTVFINSEPHDQGNPLYMSWDQLRELHGGGATIANHTVSHAHLVERNTDQDEAARRQRIHAEIDEARQRIADEIGPAPGLLAYPYGEYDQAARRIAAELGYAAFGQHSGPLSVHDDLQALPRFPFGGPYGDRQDFAIKVNSLPLPLAGVSLLGGDGQLLDDIVLRGPAAWPALQLEVAAGFDPSRLSCFASGQGPATVEKNGRRLMVRAPKPFGIGRWRINCTAPSAQPGRFYWYSQPWIVK